MPPIETRDPKSIAADVQAIARHLAMVAKHHEQCVADGNTFSKTLTMLAKDNPEALKKYLDAPGGMSVQIDGGHISGYFATSSLFSHVNDQDLQYYIADARQRRVAACDHDERQYPSGRR